MSRDPSTIVRRSLQGYADRGVFRGFSELPARGSKVEFSFLWHGEKPFDLIVDSGRRILRFNNLLPNLPSDSSLYTELKRFLKERSSSQNPAHRRIDARRAEVACVNRGGAVSITLKIKDNQYAYGINRLVNLIHEVFLHLNSSWAEYMCENFQTPQE